MLKWIEPPVVTLARECVEDALQGMREKRLGYPAVAEARLALREAELRHRPVASDPVWSGFKQREIPMLCCPNAEILPCVCRIKYDCPVHGEKCIGSHD